MTTGDPPRTLLLRTVTGALVVAGVVAACGTGRPDASAAAATALDFYRAVAAQDGAGACALLAPGTARSLEDDTDQPCAAAILDGDTGDELAARAAPRRATGQVAGRRAQARLDTDVLFLALSADRWVITAAGCDARPAGPYDCAVEGP